MIEWHLIKHVKKQEKCKAVNQELLFLAPYFNAAHTPWFGSGISWYSYPWVLCWWRQLFLLSLTLLHPRRVQVWCLKMKWIGWSMCSPMMVNVCCMKIREAGVLLSLIWVPWCLSTVLNRIVGLISKIQIKAQSHIKDESMGGGTKRFRLFSALTENGAYEEVNKHHQNIKDQSWFFHHLLAILHRLFAKRLWWWNQLAETFLAWYWAREVYQVWEVRQVVCPRGTELPRLFSEYQLPYTLSNHWGDLLQTRQEGCLLLTDYFNHWRTPPPPPSPSAPWTAAGLLPAALSSLPWASAASEGDMEMSQEIGGDWTFELL